MSASDLTNCIGASNVADPRIEFTTDSEHTTLVVAVRSDKHHDPLGISEDKSSEVLSANLKGCLLSIEERRKRTREAGQWKMTRSFAWFSSHCQNET
jgi:hypothetical protein